MFRFKCLIIIGLLLFAISVDAMPKKRFNEGPYLRLIGGVVGSDFDNNQVTGAKIGNDAEGTFGFQFGWNLWDQAAAELEGRYNTQKVRGSREHVVMLNVNLKYTFVINKLTDLGGFHILPFVFGGPGALIAGIPKLGGATESLMDIYGGGFGGGLGIDFLIKQYLFVGVFCQGDAFYITSGHDRGQKIIGGGWSPFLSVMGAVGVHF